MTLKEIATKAGVSVTTVSRVLNQKSAKAASLEVRNRIWKIAQENGYQPNKNAQLLRAPENQQVKSGGKIICIYARNSLDIDSFFQTLTEAVEKECLKHGFIVSYTLKAKELQDPLIKKIICDKSIQGFVVLGRCDKDLPELLSKITNNVVYASMNQLPTDENDQVICDGYNAGLTIMDSFISNGKNKIAYIGDTHNEARFQAYLDGLKRAGLDYRPSLVYDSRITSEGGFTGTNNILSEHPDTDAIFCMGDVLAIGAIKSAQNFGKIVGKDISILSVDDIDVAQYITPCLSTIHVPIVSMGECAVKLLADRICGGHSIPIKCILPFSLVERETFTSNISRND